MAIVPANLQTAVTRLLKPAHCGEPALFTANKDASCCCSCLGTVAIAANFAIVEEVQIASNQSPITCEELVDIEVASTQTPISVHEKEIASGDTENSKLTSDVWEYFKRQKVSGKLEYVAVCNYCHKRLSAKRKNGTGHLHTHMGLCFMRSNHTVKSTQNHLQAKKESGKCKVSTFSFNQETSRKELANMIIIHEYPLNIVEHWAFQRFVGSLQPMFRIAITTDIWTSSNQQKGFIAITSHFIDDNWELQIRIIRILYVPCPHTAEVLSEALVSCLLECLLSLNVDLFHMRCAAHILNLIVKEGMSVISDSIERIRNSVLFWSATPKRRETFYGTARKCNISCNRNLVQDFVLDPRFKMKLIEYYFDLLYGDGAKKEIENVRSFCYDMLKDYQARCKSKENSQVPVQASIASSSRAVVAHSKLGKHLANFDAFVDQSGSTTHVKLELDYYLEESIIPRSENFDILCWWKTNGSKYSTLQAIARDVLAIMVSTVASESAFSTGGRFVSPHCSRLHPKTLEALMCAQNWLFAEFDDADSSNKARNSKLSEDEDIVDEVKNYVSLT
ncbi:BED-type domain-containing protein [Citrus sinensis]|uniref:BED-type domain-containing protein n=1 Tax=Citrus sinensis TaxID=2711 RepID=A0ACB8HY02_CITSI|nr:BED-type domain-containing protein [Citrus sinensis]